MCAGVRIEDRKCPILVGSVDDLVEQISNGTGPATVVFLPGYSVNGNSCLCCIDIEKTAEMNGYESSTDGIDFSWKPIPKGGA